MRTITQLKTFSNIFEANKYLLQLDLFELIDTKYDFESEEVLLILKIKV